MSRIGEEFDLEELAEEMRQVTPDGPTLQRITGSDVSIRALELEADEEYEGEMPEDVEPLLGVPIKRNEWIPPGKLVLEWSDGTMSTLDLTGEDD